MKKIPSYWADYSQCANQEITKTCLMTVLAVGMVYLTSMAKEPVKIPLGTDKDAGMMYVYPAKTALCFQSLLNSL